MILSPVAHRTGRVRLATPADHEAIHRLNYRTFVEEIPQHAPNAERRLVDRFHEENVYAVYEVDGEIVGMVSARTQRPFSLDQKLGHIDQWLPPDSRPVEIRLLAVDPAHRATRVFARLVQFITAHFMNAGHTVGVLSGTTRQLRLYQHLGCVPFGPLVGQEGAWYQPMYVTRDTVASWSAAMVPGGNFLTGPVVVRPEVRTAFAQPPHSHRSADFHHRYAEVQSLLCTLTTSRHATLLLGSGTLANDVVGAQLLQLDGRGVVVSNGEFGDRLADHAARLGLPYDVVRAPWGHPVDFDVIDAAMISSRARWLWAVHTETSTGVVNDLDLLRTLAQRHRARLALDTVSSVGALPVNLEGVFMASAVSGKALAAFPGVAIVMHEDAPLPPHVRVPRYLDLALAVQHGGVPFTQSSNLLDALHASLASTSWPTRIAQRARDGVQLRQTLTQHGIPVLAPRDVASPAVHTIPLPPSVNAQSVGERLRHAGWHVGFESDYLRRHNWLQLCLFGEYSPSSLEALPRAVAEALSGA